MKFNLLLPFVLIYVIHGHVLYTRSPSTATTITTTGDVEISATPFKGIPRRLFYFKDSKVVLYYDSTLNNVFRSSDEGKTWNKVLNVPDGVVDSLIQHPHDNSIAYILTVDLMHYYTADKGETWVPFQTELPPTGEMDFHATEPHYAIYMGCKKKRGGFSSGSCDKTAYYTRDLFQNTLKLLSDTDACVWGRGTKEFSKVVSSELVLCTEWPDKSRASDDNMEDLRLVSSSDFFESQKDIISINGGVVGIGLKGNFLIAAVKPRDISTMMMYVSLDGKHFANAQFPLDSSFTREGYTILESTASQIAVNVLASSSDADTPSYGALFLSNSNGTFFRKSLDHVNRNKEGHVDFERMEAPNFQGIIFANLVHNWKEASDGYLPEDFKQIQTMVSFNSGGKFQYLQPPPKNADGSDWECSARSPAEPTCSLHLHSVTKPHNLGRVLSTKAAPGFVVGVGSVGSELKPYEACDTFFSSDGGLNFEAVAKGPHKYELADMGSILFLVKDTSSVEEIIYSLDRGETFVSVPLHVGDHSKWIPHLTLLDPESTSQMVLMLASPVNDESSNYLMHFDFSKLRSRQCAMDPNNPDASSDFEVWRPRGSDEGECFLGQDIRFYRPKDNADCYVGREFEDPELTIKTCACTEADYECDYNYFQDAATSATKCITNYPNSDQPADCKLGTTFKGTSGFRKIAGDLCTGDLHPSVDKECLAPSQTPGSGKSPNNVDPEVFAKDIPGLITRVEYFVKSDIPILQTSEQKLYTFYDKDQKWKEIALVNEKGAVDQFIPHPYEADRGFVVFKDGTVWYTADQFASDFTKKQVKNDLQLKKFGLGSTLEFSPNNKNWLLFTACSGSCEDEKNYRNVALLSDDNGQSWVELEDPLVEKCAFAKGTGLDLSTVADNAIYCLKREEGAMVGPKGGRQKHESPLRVVLYEPGRKKTVLTDIGVKDYNLVSDMLIISVKEFGILKLHVSTDGKTVQEAAFPRNVNIQGNGFTLLDSDSGGVFVNSWQNMETSREYGTLLISSRDGTQFNWSLSAANQDAEGLVDFQKLKGVPGIIFANKVSNANELAMGSEVKKALQTVASFDNGSTWKPIGSPKSSDGCSPLSENCRLNLHMSARAGKLNNSGSNSNAVGLMIGVGSVGKTLPEYDDCDVFLSRDAGRSWSNVKEHAHHWAFGDHGGIIVLVNDEEPTDKISYSWNFGETFVDYIFATRKVRVNWLSIESSSTSNKFVIAGVYDSSTSNGESTESFVARIDFSKIFERQCKESDGDDSDFTKWSLHEETKDKDGNSKVRCFLGQKISYHQRKSDALCAVGQEFEELPKMEEKCECTEGDFECDVNFWRDDEDKCELFQQDPKQPQDCEDGETYRGSTGYRKIGLTECEGGVNLEGEEDRICGSFDSTPGGEVFRKSTLFDYKLRDYHFFDHTATVIWTDTFGYVHLSKNSGSDWTEKWLEEVKISSFHKDAYRGNRLFFISNLEKKLYFTDDNCESFKTIDVPVKSDPLFPSPLEVHPTEENYLLWTGVEGKYAATYYSQDLGKTWKELETYTERCRFGRDSKFLAPEQDSVFCVSHKDKTGNQMPKHTYNRGNRLLRSTSDFGKTWTDHFEHTIQFAVFETYMVAAVLDKDDSELDLHISRNGVDFVEAILPTDFKAGEGYTVLESTTGFMYLDLFVYRNRVEPSLNMGYLFVSDTSGTKFTRSLAWTNRDRSGFVDFEKLQGVKGISLANAILNPEKVKESVPKQLGTSISFDDGETWQSLSAPEKDLKGNPYPQCEKDKNCGLHIHAFTDRRDRRDQYSTKSAAGLLVAVGNVGQQLADYEKCDVFLSRDAGKSWKEVAKEAHMYEIGNRGSIIVLVEDESAGSDKIKYSVDGGDSFKDLRIDSLDNAKLDVSHIITDNDAVAAQFLVFGTVKSGDNRGKNLAFHVDFKSEYPRDCVINKEDESKSDFESWNPHGKDVCRFGEMVTYFRRKPSKNCYVNPKEEPPVDRRPCECKREDFTCDANYELKDAECVLMEGKKALELPCVDGESQLSTGYRKLQGNGCAGGTDLSIGKKYSCGPSASEGRGFFGWLFTILLWIGIIGGVGWLFMRFRHLIPANPFQREGHIRLPTDDFSRSSGGGGSDFGSRASSFLQATIVYTIEAAEIGLMLSKKAFDFVRRQVVGGRRTNFSYAPLDTHDIPATPDLNGTSLFDVDSDAERFPSQSQ